MPQVVIDNFQALVWHQAPQCYYPNPASQYHWAHLYWYCRNGRTPGTESNPATSPGCANEVHAWTACPGDIRWRALLSDGSGGASPIIQCRIKSGYGYFSGTHNGGVTALGSTGWVGMGTPYAFYVECKGPTPGPGPGGINTARACWNGGPCEYQTNPTDIPW